MTGKLHSDDELGGLRRLLRRLETGQLMIRQGDFDVTQREINVLKKEIAYLERIVTRAKLEKRHPPRSQRQIAPR
jgi:hypothetical protein